MHVKKVWDATKKEGEGGYWSEQFNAIFEIMKRSKKLFHLLFLKVNPNVKCCHRFNLTSMINFTVLPLFN